MQRARPRVRGGSRTRLRRGRCRRGARRADRATSRRWPMCSFARRSPRTAGLETRRGPTRATHGLFWRVWESRLGAPRTWSGVVTIGGAIAGTAHVRPWAGRRPRSGVVRRAQRRVRRSARAGSRAGSAAQRRGDRGRGAARLHRPASPRDRAQHARASSSGSTSAGHATASTVRSRASGGMLEHRYMSPGTREVGR